MGLGSAFRSECFCVFIGLILAFASNFQYGYSTTFLNTPVDEFKGFLNVSLTKMGKEMTESTYNTIWNLILNITFVGFFFGIWLNPLLNDRYGRKVGFLCGNFLSLLSSLLRFFGIAFYRPELLFISRITTSLCNAVTYQSLILYLQECAPTHLRGLLTFLSEIMFSSMCMLGMLLGTDELLGKDLFWLTFVAVPPCIFAFFVLFLIPETPKYLLITKGDKIAAEKSVRFFHGNLVDAHSVLQKFEMESIGDSGSAPFIFTCKEIFQVAHLRNAVILSCVCLQNCVGMWSLLLSSTYFLESSNVPSEVAEWSSTGMMIFYVMGTVVGSAIIEIFGRRPLLLLFTSLNVLAQIVYVLFDKLHDHLDSLKYGCVVSLAFYGFTYGCATGPVSWFISSELVPQKYRSCVQSICYAVNTVMVVITTFSVLPLYNSIGSYSFIVLYVVPSVLCLIYMYRFLPETKGREIHDIVNDLQREPTGK